MFNIGIILLLPLLLLIFLLLTKICKIPFLPRVVEFFIYNLRLTNFSDFLDGILMCKCQPNQRRLISCQF